MLEPKQWLDKNEWENTPIDSEAWSHHTMLDTLMKEYAKYYMKEKLKGIEKKININKFI